MNSHSAYKDRSWSRQPEAETVYRAILDDMLGRCPDATEYAARLLQATGIRIRDIVDHIATNDDTLVARIETVGWRPAGDGIWQNPEGMFPAFVRGDRARVWLKAESVEDFLSANGLDAPIEGKAHGPIRKIIAFAAPEVDFGIVERNGYPGYVVEDTPDALIRTARIHLQAFRARRRQFDTVEEGLAYTEALVDTVVADIGAHWACDLWLKAEREFWMGRCPSGRLQKERQDKMGIGWANIDHHTYDGSRRHFRHTIGILEKLGYELREMLYAGELAGWGSQVLEQPVIGSTIFADVDLAPEELSIDFAHEALPELGKHRRAGILSALLGESILEAGLNHVAGLFDQKLLRAQLEREGLVMMTPFTDWSHLYQELTEGDWAAVDPERVDSLERDGHIGPTEAEGLRLNGSIVTHFENIERNEGYKGFNREGIDSVLRKIDPRAYLGKEAPAK